MIRQTRDGSLAQSLQFVGFRERLGSIFYLLPHAGTLRLGKILGSFHVTDPDGRVSVNLYRGAIGKDNVVERHVGCSRAREIATQNLPFTSGLTGNRRDMSFDR